MKKGKVKQDENDIANRNSRLNFTSHFEVVFKCDLLPLLRLLLRPNRDRQEVEICLRHTHICGGENWAPQTKRTNTTLNYASS